MSGPSQRWPRLIAAALYVLATADPDGVADRKDIRLMVGREFDPAGFDAMIALVSRCSRFTTAGAGAYTVTILEDSRPADGPQRFRYALTSTLSGKPADATRTEYFSYARRSGLILTGSASSGHQQAFGALSERTCAQSAPADLIGPHLFTAWQSA
ncbi:hypothetical protein [Mycobacterium lacus]|uniref:Uncharacterized protein n=1 Tax=Mycobacterium lacus TaxID=169765 RepID=A0A7I7NJT8_9MYCO|nr:hypothetical protein [Mycobacterium lacus]BBX96648.1 hypothetical protein MLAC_19420 [Mycobacterium lacus]